MNIADLRTDLEFRKVIKPISLIQNTNEISPLMTESLAATAAGAIGPLLAGNYVALIGPKVTEAFGFQYDVSRCCRWQEHPHLECMVGWMPSLPIKNSTWYQTPVNYSSACDFMREAVATIRGQYVD